MCGRPQYYAEQSDEHACSDPACARREYFKTVPSCLTATDKETGISIRMIRNYVVEDRYPAFIDIVPMSLPLPAIIRAAAKRFDNLIKDPIYQGRFGKITARFDATASIAIYATVFTPFVDLLGVPYTEKEVGDIAYESLCVRSDAEPPPVLRREFAATIINA